MLSPEQLHSYQRFGVSHIIEKPEAGLFLDMGLGKTVITLTAIRELLDRLEVGRVLVIGPKRVVSSVWIQEAQKWKHTRWLTFSLISGTPKQRAKALNAEADVYLLGRDNVAWLCDQYGGSYLPFDMLILDELSSFKNHQSQRFKALKRVRKSVDRVVGLTGTPAPNGLIDLWAQVFLLDNGERLGRSIGRYRETYFSPGQTNGAIVYNYSIKQGAQAAIYKAIGDICVSMEAKDFLDMPEKVLIDERVDFTPELRAKYKDFEKELVLSLFSGETEISVANAAALSNKLLQFANGAVYDEAKAVHAVHDLKLDKLEDIYEAANGKPLLVAIAFRHDAERILKRFKAIKPRVLDGQKDIDDWNAGRVPMLILHPASGGHGLNIQHGSNFIVWYGLNWSLELYKQLNARLWRQGQKAKRVFIYRILSAGTLDERVVRTLGSKDLTEGELMAAVKPERALVEAVREIVKKYI